MRSNLMVEVIQLFQEFAVDSTILLKIQSPKQICVLNLHIKVPYKKQI